ncbi:MAG: hypothetical protein JSV52_08455 [Candidatus Zixiibacteriota bacterium]|nr:MAG: hypothetical protein JSV52_08455 [candidate division Zixibacteria bacterium]
MSANNSEPGGGYERSDVNVRMVVLIAVGVIVVVIVALIVLNEYFLSVKEQYVYDLVLKPESVTLRDLRAAEDEVLNSYKLLDSAGGVYRIPIERAMELVAEEAYRASQGR